MTTDSTEMGNTYIVGDIHGCLDPFEALLERLEFVPKRDRLWLVGDIVNRGPDSLAVLRRAIQLERAMGDRFQMVLGTMKSIFSRSLSASAGYAPRTR